MRILISSLIAFACIACASYPKKNGFEAVENIAIKVLNPYFSDRAKDYVYKAKVEAFDKTFGGLLILKKLGINHHRIVFTTEMGNTLFDFSFQNGGFRVNRIVKEMDRKILISILKKDFAALIVEQPPVLQTFIDNDNRVYATDILSKKHYFYRSEGQLDKIVRVKNAKEKVVFLFSETEVHRAGKIEILHSGFPLAITLIGIY
ncbi:hypothetical protein RQM65_07995 [Pricia sp. S334]|uniref:DUF4292 domain-containing protein n=1 Tax=Pricia mediterranea TaxID=3076079 RepID=A0ABU3L579_9FLAO|nr:hypothetical protein [Pricia sp. S334]MDT7828602.1 hypothetical protein [Pricia sp. S334]